MKLSWRYLPFLLVLLLLAGLAFLNPELFITYLIAPITRILWLIVRTFLVIDQDIYWLLLIFAAFMLILKIIPGRHEYSYRTAYSDSTPAEDRAAYWEALLQSAEDNADARLILQQELKDLDNTIDVLVEGDGQGDTDLPPIKTGVVNGHQAIWKKYKLFRFLPKRDSRPETVLERRVDAILNSMEVKLEMNNDRSSNLSNDH